uniref:Uncharacterized protein n=1 Tax=Romanomermis culicivorax TaxID=13658 RepID=A0A915ILH1_ROMCU
QIGGPVGQFLYFLVENFCPKYNDPRPDIIWITGSRGNAGRIPRISVEQSIRDDQWVVKGQAESVGRPWKVYRIVVYRRGSKVVQGGGGGISGQGWSRQGGSRVRVSAKVTEGKDGVLKDNAKVAPVNLTLHALFRDVILKANGRQPIHILAKATNTYPYKAL